MDISVDKVVDFIDRVRAFDVREGATDPDSGSNAIDDGMTDTLTADDEGALEQELRSFIAGLNVDERASLVALAWVGRGDFDAEDWPEALRAARGRSETPAADYLLGIPNIGDLLDEGLAAMTEEDDLPAARDPEDKPAPPSGLHPELSETDLAPEDDDAP